MGEQEKYEWLYANTTYARMRGRKHLDDNGKVNSEGHWANMWRDVHRWYNEIGCNGKILDVGSGPCNLARAANDLSSFKVTSVDFASSANPDVVAFAHDMPFKDNEFDLVTSIDMLEHVPHSDVDSTLRELARVSRVGAMFTIHYGRERRRYDQVGVLHITIHDHVWWRQRIEKWFEVMDRRGKFWYLKSKRGV